MGVGGVRGAKPVSGPAPAEVSGEREPMVSTRDCLRDFRMGAVYVKAGVSEEYQRRIRRIVSKLKKQGIDIEKYGSVRMDGTYNQLFHLHTAAGVDRTNTLFVGFAGGMEDWRLELFLVHEFRHQVQNHEAWNRFAKREGVNPEDWPLARAMREGKVPRRFETVLEAFYDWHENDEGEHVYDELDAYIFEYEYFLEMAFAKRELDLGQRHEFLTYIYEPLGKYLSNATNLSEEVNKRMENRKIVERAEQLRKFLGKHLSKYREEPNSLRRSVLQSMDARAKRMFNEKSAFLRYPTGRSLALRDRLIVLQGALGHLSGMDSSLLGLSSSHAAVAIDDFVRGAHSQLDRLLNRQAVRYQYQLSADRHPHQLRYSNDTWNLSDGSLRAQHLAEVDFDAAGNAAGRAGHDFGVYFPVPHVPRLYLKGAPLVFAGYQTDRDDFHIGARLDLGLQYDLDWTQRVGTSLFVGYSLGGEWGTQEREAYHLLGAGLEAFRF